MPLEILENKIPLTQFQVGDHITNGNYDYKISSILPCQDNKFIRCHPILEVCRTCTIQLSYVSGATGKFYCSQAQWRLLKPY